MRATWLGHATVLLEADGVRLLTDPLLRGRLGHLRRFAPEVPRELASEVDAVLISHLHWDHLDVGSMRLLPPRTTVIGPHGVGGVLRAAGMRHVVELEVGDSMQVGILRVTAVEANHSGFRPPFGPHGTALGYLVEGSERVYFAGDTGLFPGMADLGDVDLALLPVGGWGPWLRGGHLDPAGAVDALRRIRPAAVLPIHWGTYWPLGLPRTPRFDEPGPRFAALAARAMPEVRVHLLSPGSPAAMVKSGVSSVR
jgi:L-ascorbate metabolism protein UlaG (beta-lactamase superfamily)